jgi:hypothetical protein
MLPAPRSSDLDLLTLLIRPLGLVPFICVKYYLAVVARSHGQPAERGA